MEPFITVTVNGCLVTCPTGKRMDDLLAEPRSTSLLRPLSWLPVFVWPAAPSFVAIAA